MAESDEDDADDNFIEEINKQENSEEIIEYVASIMSPFCKPSSTKLD